MMEVENSIMEDHFVPLANDTNIQSDDDEDDAIFIGRKKKRNAIIEDDDDDDDEDDSLPAELSVN
ncbi:hypothetical protein LSH36_118g00000, partial [Paralvinella palmiformis]